MFCPRCGASRPDGSQFCPSCDFPPFAGFWIRVVANMLDGLILIVLGIVGYVIVRIATDSQATLQEVGSLVTFGWCFYEAGCLSGYQRATPGKRKLGIIVTDTRGQRISFGRALVRTFAKVLNNLTLGLGWILVGLTPRKRGLHDFVGGTLAIRPRE